MRHGCKVNHLSRTHSHRVAMMSNMATSLIMHKRVETTLAKAKDTQSPYRFQLPAQQGSRQRTVPRGVAEDR